MQWIDSLSPPFRMLVRQYGMAIVFDMMVKEGYTDPFELQELLEVRHERRQKELLQQDHFPPHVVERIMEGFRNGLRRMR